MVGVVVGGLMVLAAVAVSTWSIVVAMRALSDATTRAQVTVLKGAALGQGRDVPEVTSVYDDQPAELPPAEPMRRVAPARRLRAVEPPPAPGVILPGQAAAEPEPRTFGGW